MAARTAADVEADLVAAYAARRKCLDGQAWTYNGRSVTRANLADLNKTILGLESELRRLTYGGIRVRGGVATA